MREGSLFCFVCFGNIHVQVIKKSWRNIMKLALIYSECLSKILKTAIIIVDKIVLFLIIVDLKEWIHTVSSKSSHNINKLLFQTVELILHSLLHLSLYISLCKKNQNDQTTNQCFFYLPFCGGWKILYFASYFLIFTLSWEWSFLSSGNL